MTVLGKGVKLEISLEILWWNSGSWGQPRACANRRVGFSWLRVPTPVLTALVLRRKSLASSQLLGSVGCWLQWHEKHLAAISSRNPLSGHLIHPQNKKKASSREEGRRFLREMSLSELAHSYRTENILNQVRLQKTPSYASQQTGAELSTTTSSQSLEKALKQWHGKHRSCNSTGHGSHLQYK